MSAHPTPERLGAYLDGELEAAARAAVDAHLRECAECGAHLADLSAVDDVARQEPLGAPAGYFDDFAPRVRARLERKAPARWRPPVWGWAAAAALLLAVITPLALRERREAPMGAASEHAPATSSVPAVAADAATEEDARSGFKQNEAPAPAGGLGAPPATVIAPKAPAPRAAAPEEELALRSRGPESPLERREGALSRDTRGDDRAPAAAPELRDETQPKREVAEPAQAAAESAKLAKQKPDEAQMENLRALGYVAPPPPPASANQRQHGPRSQNTMSAPPAKYTPETKDKEQAADAVAEKAAAGTAAPGAVMQESVDVSPQPRDVLSGRASVKFRSLAESDPPRSDGDARALREAWRVFVAENPDHPQADEARVRLVEAGALAYRLGRQPRDREIAQRDARAYLERPTAPRAARVRAALSSLER